MVVWPIMMCFYLWKTFKQPLAFIIWVLESPMFESVCSFSLSLSTIQQVHWHQSTENFYQSSSTMGLGVMCYKLWHLQHRCNRKSQQVSVPAIKVELLLNQCAISKEQFSVTFLAVHVVLSSSVDWNLYSRICGFYSSNKMQLTLTKYEFLIKVP